jgi:uncharacterized protein YbaR (Trm112 family)
MKKSPMKRTEEYQEMLEKNRIEKIMIDRQQSLIDKGKLTCPDCGNDYRIDEDLTLRCQSMSCKQFAKIAPGSQIYFDF